MELSSAGILAFFFSGIALHLFLRNALPWTEQQRPFFWLTAMGLFGLGVFVIPMLTNDSRLPDALNCMVAGACISEYLRVRYKDKIAKIVNFKNEVAKWKEQEQKQEPGKPEKPRRPSGERKPGSNKPRKE